MQKPATIASSSGVYTVPVGLFGLHSTTIRVRGVSAFSHCSRAGRWKPSSPRLVRGTSWSPAIVAKAV